MAQNTFDFSYFWGKLSTILGGKANTSDLASVAESGSYNDLIDKPTIPPGVVVDQTYDSTSENAQSGAAVAEAIATVPTPNDATLTVQKNGTTVDTFSANASQNKTINITVPTSAADVSALPASTKYGATLALAIDSTTYVVTATLKDQDGNTLGTAQTIDLPLETMVVSGSYDSASKKVVLTLKNGSTVEFSVADLISGLQSEITAQSPLDADLVDDTTSAHKFATAAQLSKVDGITELSNAQIDTIMGS